jgi:hypothetical protein
MEDHISLENEKTIQNVHLRNYFVFNQPVIAVTPMGPTTTYLNSQSRWVDGRGLLDKF